MNFIISLHWLWLILLVLSGLFMTVVIIINFLLAMVTLFFDGGIFELLEVLGSVFGYLAISTILTAIFLVLYLISISAKVITRFL